MQTNYCHHPFYCYTEDLFAFFSCVILTKCNLRSLSEPSYYFATVPSFFPDVVFLICFYCYSVFDKLSPVYHHYFHCSLVWNCLHSLHFNKSGNTDSWGTPFPLLKKPRWCCLRGEQSSWDPSQLPCFLTKLFSNWTFLSQERDLTQGST